MLAPLPLEPISLAARSVHRIENAKGIRVSCVRGVAWITQERKREGDCTRILNWLCPFAQSFRLLILSLCE